MLPVVHWAPQPLRVAGPMQTTPWARKQSSGSASNWCGRLNSVMLRFVGLDFLREHSSHRAMSGARTEPLGGSLPSRSAVMAAFVRVGVGGQPGMQFNFYRESIKPMKAVFDQYYVKRLNGTHVKKGKNKRDLANQIVAD